MSSPLVAKMTGPGKLGPVRGELKSQWKTGVPSTISTMAASMVRSIVCAAAKASVLKRPGIFTLPTVMAARPVMPILMKSRRFIAFSLMS